MNLQERFEAFYEPQPRQLFIDELKSPLHKSCPEFFGREVLKKGEVLAKGVRVVNEFPDDDGLLETAFSDFDLFLKVYGIKGDKFSLYVRKEPTRCFEAYKISVDERGCILSADDTEGIRRGLVFLEDEFCRREGPILPLGDIERYPGIRNRITRGFFSPTNRPPLNIDELMNDVDYYPEEYLNRLAHDGTNGLWIYTRLSDLVKTDIIPEWGVGREKRIAKLKAIINRCKRYGIKVYIFFIDPAFLPDNMYEKYSDIASIRVDWAKGYTFCTSSERGAKYCIEAMQKLCEALPDIGGVIDITNGERITSCASADPDKCPRCKGKSRAEVLAQTVNLLKEGMRRANSSAEFVSWTYGHRSWEFNEIKEYVEKAPQDVVIMQNFEENGITEQLGKPRMALDYWLSYVGPSEKYIVSADAAKKGGKEMYAKMQVCCSHELATVPYIPVPGILFDKYNTELAGVMQCWYFGNYPSLMSKAAGELSFLHDFSDKQSFLENLAGIYYGGGKAAAVAKAWKCFEDGYKNYPVNILFSYYGPAHDGIVWELQLKPKNYPLSRSWLFKDAAEGDRIGNCLFDCHTIEETVELLGEIKKHWAEGLRLMPDDSKEQSSVSNALYLLFSSAWNVMEFYRLRLLLAKNPNNSLELLGSMRELVLEEIENSKKMIPLCENDPRLGYHSEAEHFKFYPAQLKKRITLLKRLLDTEFPEVEERIKNGFFPLEYFLGDKDGYRMAKTLETAQAENIADTDASFKVAYDSENIYLELDGKKDHSFSIGFEYTPTLPGPEIICEKGKTFLNSTPFHGYFGEKRAAELAKYRCEFLGGERDVYRLTIGRKDVGWTTDTPLKLRITNDGISWIKSENAIRFLHIFQSPDEFGWLMP